MSTSRTRVLQTKIALQLLVPPNNRLTRIQQFQMVQDRRVLGFAFISLEKLAPRFDQSTTQHVRISLIVQNRRGLPNKLYCLLVGAIGKIESTNSIITSG